MAKSLSMVYGISVSCSSKVRGFTNLPFSLGSNVVSSSSSSSSSPPQSLSHASLRGTSRFRATVLKEDEERIGVEPSFPPKSSPGNGGGDNQEPPESSSSDGSQKLVVKIEQSINIFLTDTVIKVLDTFYHDRPYARFFVLETIARVPYFAFMSVLHAYETFGWWRRADYLQVHFAESWNEMHHLLIMEELGGNAWWFDRFLATHMAFFYYWMTVFMYALSPRMAYHFSECVEGHAFETYDKFIEEEGEELKKLPPSKIAVKYYTEGDLYLFDEFQSASVPNTRRPKIDNMYDVFMNIRDDEAEHCKTMKACQVHGSLRSPHNSCNTEDAGEEDTGDGCVIPEGVECEGLVDCLSNSLSDPK